MQLSCTWVCFKGITPRAQLLFLNLVYYFLLFTLLFASCFIFYSSLVLMYYLPFVIIVCSLFLLFPFFIPFILFVLIPLFIVLFFLYSNCVTFSNSLFYCFNPFFKKLINIHVNFSHWLSSSYIFYLNFFMFLFAN